MIRWIRQKFCAFVFANFIGSVRQAFELEYFLVSEPPYEIKDDILVCPRKRAAVSFC